MRLDGVTAGDGLSLINGTDGDQRVTFTHLQVNGVTNNVAFPGQKLLDMFHGLFSQVGDSSGRLGTSSLLGTRLASLGNSLPMALFGAKNGGGEEGDDPIGGTGEEEEERGGNGAGIGILPG